MSARQTRRCLGNRLVFAVMLCLGLSGCGSTPVASRGGAADTIYAYVSAYNAHDIPRMLEMVTADIRWMSITSADIGVVTVGKAALADALRQYFADMPTTRSRVHQLLANGRFVAVVEEARWESGGAQRSQCGIAVYEIRDRLIANVWYHDAQPCDALK